MQLKPATSLNTTRALALSASFMALLTLGQAAQAACPSVSTASRYVITGAEVTDLKTGLVWARCSLGQTWSGSACTGTASTHTHQDALTLANSASGWRLPNVKELASIADKGCLSPAIDVVAFPNTSANAYWSSTAYVGYPSYAWFVEFGNGDVGYNFRSNSSRVRLVRASQ
jgi:hypothetical protein